MPAAFVRTRPDWVRAEVAWQYLRGDGIEIGALHKPLALPPGAKARYVDRAATEELRKQYPEFNDLKLVPVSVISDAQTLQGVSDESQAFVIANHVIEHMEDSIRAVQNWLRVLRPGGVIYLVLPDKRFTFDWPREVTSIEHVRRDYKEGPHVSRREHYREWADLVMITQAAKVEDRAAELEAQRVSIHFHVWGTPAFTKFLVFLRSEMKLPLEIALLRRNGAETIFVLEKT